MEEEATKAKKVPLHNIHESYNAKIIPFAGFYMPVRYTSDKEEHLAVRNKAGIFDVSHMGEFKVTGPQALDLLQWITTNDVSKLSPGKIQYTTMPNGKGGIVDDLLIYNIDHNAYMVVVNAANIEKDRNWINQNNQWDADITDISDDIVLLAIQGPKATEILQSLTETNLYDIPFYTFKKGTFAGISDVIISATGYTGEPGFELYLPAKHAENIWKKILAEGEPYGLIPVGLGARDTLRLEAGLCLYGNDIDDTTSPIEAKLGWITKFDKDFIDKERLQKQKEEGVSRKLVSFEMIEKGIPRHGYDIYDRNNQKIGHVTSGTMSPSLNKGIGMGYVSTHYSKPDTEIYIQIRNKNLKAKTLKGPFIKK